MSSRRTLLARLCNLPLVLLCLLTYPFLTDAERGERTANRYD